MNIKKDNTEFWISRLVAARNKMVEMTGPLTESTGDLVPENAIIYSLKFFLNNYSEPLVIWAEGLSSYPQPSKVTQSPAFDDD